MRTFENAQQDKSEDGEGNLGIGRSSTEAPEDSLGDMKDILFKPSQDAEGAGDRRSIERETRRQESQQELNLDLADSFGVDLDDMDQAIKDLYQVDLETVEELEILRFIAEAMRVQTLHSKVMLDQASAMSVFLNDIATAVEATTDVVLSGTVTVDRSEVPQEVLEEVGAVRTRTIYVKSDPKNEKPIYFGDDGIEPEDGFVLVPGESETFNVNYRDAELYMVSEEQGAVVQLLGLI